MTKETRQTGDPLAALDRAFADGGNRRSPLKQAMLDDYERMAAKLKGKRPNWRRLTEEFMRAGFRNMDGSDLDPENVRVMWFEVRRMKGAVGGRGPAAIPAVNPATDPVAVGGPVGLPVTEQTDPGERPRFKPASLPGRIVDPDDAVRRIKEQAVSSAPKMPKPMD